MAQKCTKPEWETIEPGETCQVPKEHASKIFIHGRIWSKRFLTKINGEHVYAKRIS